MWKVISFSQVKVPLRPYLSEYVLAIAEDSEGRRRVVRIDNKHVELIVIGAKGTVRTRGSPTGRINVFEPEVKMGDFDKREVGKKQEFKIQKIGIVGTGTMGVQLACLAAKYGFSVVLKGRSLDSCKRAMKRVEEGLRQSMSSSEARKVKETIKLATRWDSLFSVDLVIECVLEERRFKEAVFRKLGKVCRTRAILSTNTSSLSIDELAVVSSRPAKVIGIHFFNPAEKIRLVEVVKGKKTSESTVEAVKDFSERVGKLSLVVRDSPGFIVNRLLFAMINEAAYLLQEKNERVEDIDSAMKFGANHPMGPFELADFIGVDLTYKIIEELHQAIDGFRPPAQVLKEMIKSGKLGRKSKEGFYKY